MSQVEAKRRRVVRRPQVKPSAQAMVLNAYLAAKLWDRAPFSQWPRAGECA